MKNEISFLFLLILLVSLFSFLPHTMAYEKEIFTKANNLSSDEKEELIEKYYFLKSRLDYLEWYVQKFNLKEDLGALSYLVIDNSDPTVLLEKNSSSSYPIASITKLITAVVASENIDTNREVILDQEMFLINSWQRESPAIFPGAKVLVGDLMKASLIQSTNNAAHSLTHLTSERDYIDLMNEKAKEIGMKNTFFYDAHGISSQNCSSAEDLGKLLVYIMENDPELLEITREEKFQLPGSCPEHNWICTFMNLNVFHGIAEFVGGKTGFTKAAGKTFAGVFSFQDRPYSIILLNTKSRTDDTQKITQWLKNRPPVTQESL